MNKLSYGLLSFLSVEELTGYELTQKIKLFWHTNHSAVYTLLSELEQNTLITYKLVKQSGKPDKKIYSITKSGLDNLKSWVVTDLSSAVRKDEMNFKLFCMEVLDKDTVELLIQKIESRCISNISRYLNRIEELKESYNLEKTNIDSPKIGTFFILQKRLNESKLELEWCKWVRKFNKDKSINLFNNPFDIFNEILN